MGHLENINQDISYALHEHISYELIEYSYIVLNLNNGEYYELNNSSSFIWNQIAKQNSLKEIIENTKNHFRISDDKVPEILSIIDKFEYLELIKKIEN
tara:strand:- start:20 stop:313 length:294 start_codon:yes stop_codon:yes gene_type:complete